MRLKKLNLEKGKEIHITDAIKNLINKNENFMEIFLKENT